MVSDIDDMNWADILALQKRVKDYHEKADKDDQEIANLRATVHVLAQELAIAQQAVIGRFNSLGNIDARDEDVVSY